jgi:two-component system, OmpR family, response regulator
MRLLLVEDDTELVKTLKPALQRAGFAVDIADNGVDAEYLGNENLHDAVVLDLGIPQRNGLQVLQNWRSLGNAIPVIILTARDAWHERVDGLKAGADDYLGKPFHTEELIMRINAVMHRYKQQPGGKLTSSGITLDEETQTITDEHGTTSSLTGTEFRLLRYFLLHPDRILSKSRLMEHIYDDEEEKDSNVIEAYVRRLRKLLGKDRIETRRGQGYLFRG